MGQKTVISMDECLNECMTLEIRSEYFRSIYMSGFDVTVPVVFAQKMTSFSILKRKLKDVIFFAKTGVKIRR